MSGIDETHDPRRGSWVASANGHGEFPIQNLPFGVFSPAGGAARGGVAIGDMIFDLAAALEVGAVCGRGREGGRGGGGAGAEPADGARRRAAHHVAQAALRAARRRRRRARQDRSARRTAAAPGRGSARCICRPRSANSPISSPAFITRATAGAGAIRTTRSAPITNTSRSPITAAPRRCGRRMCRSGGPLASGRRRTRPTPSFGPCRKLDYELELAVWIGPGNAQGEPIPIDRAADHIFGLGLRQRLVGARRAGLGIAAAGAVSRQEFRFDGVALDRHDRGAGAVSPGPAAAARRRPAAVAAFVGRCGSARGRLRHRTRSPSLDRGAARERPAAAADVGQQHDRPLLDLGATRRASYQRRLQSVAPATCSAPARSPARRARAMAA